MHIHLKIRRLALAMIFLGIASGTCKTAYTSERKTEAVNDEDQSRAYQRQEHTAICGLSGFFGLVLMGYAWSKRKEDENSRSYVRKELNR